MSCLITSGLTKSCGYLVGGIVELWVTNYFELSSVTTSTTTWVGGATQPKWFKIQPEKNTGSFIDELVVNNGQKARNQSLTFQLSKKDTLTLAVMDQLSLGTFTALVKDRNDVIYAIGVTNGMEATVSSVSSGANETDVAGLNVTIAGLQTDPIFVYTGTITV